MAVVPHHLPSKQIWSDCLIKPAALSAIHTGFLPAKYSIIHVNALEQQGNKRQSDLNLRSKNSLAYLSLKDITPDPPVIVRMQKLWQSRGRVPTKIVSSSRRMKVSPSSSRHGDFASTRCSKTPKSDDFIIICGEDTFGITKQNQSERTKTVPCASRVYKKIDITPWGI